MVTLMLTLFRLQITKFTEIGIFLKKKEIFHKDLNLKLRFIFKNSSCITDINNMQTKDKVIHCKISFKSAA